MRAWTERTGKSERAFYRRLAEMTVTESSKVSICHQSPSITDPNSTRTSRCGFDLELEPWRTIALCTNASIVSRPP